MAEQITFKADGFQLEGIIDRISEERAVIITHPHPQYGGDMYNSVVSSIQTAYSNMQYSTLRFNFRGSGHSEGQFDNGIGEQRDVLAALEYLIQKGFKSIDLAGYSFGAWVNAQTSSQSESFQNLIMVSPPVDFMDFNNIQSIPMLSLVIVGSRDDFASVGNIEKVVPVWNETAKVEIIEGADHFYGGANEELVNIISSRLAAESE
jgi:uncharacterized protein